MKALFRILLILVTFFGQEVFSVEMKGLFETEVIASSQELEDRNDAIRKAMTIVLERVLAGENILQDPAVKTALAQAPFFTKQFQYSLVENSFQEESSARTMRVLINEDSLMDLLKSSRLGIWGEVRPETLVWLVVDEDSKRRFFKSEEMPTLDFALSQAAKQKGLPLIFPLLDLEEREMLSVNDVLSAYPDQLLDISSRYDVVSILAGRITKKGDCWQAEWALYFDQTVRQWMQPCQALSQTLLEGMAGVYSRLSDFYSVKPDVPEIGTVFLNITGISGMTDMTRVTEYLQSVSMIKSVAWVSVNGGYNRYKINYEGDRRVFENMLALGRVLTPLSDNKVALDEINYRLLTDSNDF